MSDFNHDAFHAKRLFKAAGAYFFAVEIASNNGVMLDGTPYSDYEFGKLKDSLMKAFIGYKLDPDKADVPDEILTSMDALIDKFIEEKKNGKEHTP